jgi:phosphoribosylamine---glycine ligase
MRVLGIGGYLDLGDLYLRLQARGHEVRVFVEDEASRDILDGMVTKSARVQDDLAWVGRDGLVVFETVGQGERQDALRREGYRVVGGSAFGDRLELDRAFGQRVLRDAGLRTALTHEVQGFDAAIELVTRDPRRWVLKFSGAGYASTRSYVGQLNDGRDVLGMLQHQRRRWTHDDVPRVVLMAHLEGVEVGVGAFFDGRAFIGPPNLDWEHKRFFPGDLGELTGEMGTVVSYRGGEKLFEATLARLAPSLREAGHVGYVNLNLIVNEEGTWPLELTCRFGYPGFAILSELHVDPWDTILLRMVEGGTRPIATHAGYGVGIVLTVPSFPYPDGYERLAKGAPIFFHHDLDEHDRAAMHYAEVRLDGDQLVTAGEIGYVMVATARGATLDDARTRALSRARKVIIPNVRYRTDIGERLQRTDRARLVRLGWLDD